MLSAPSVSELGLWLAPPRWGPLAFPKLALQDSSRQAAERKLMPPNRILKQLAISVITACLIVIVLHLTGLAPG
jgi:hypothetical protein